ncbi:L,D-transpeptidase family protein [Arcobacteraceae bacterium]|nr:L,D-transpeptidase family protein [Arcobacteraceae bacterium]
MIKSLLYIIILLSTCYANNVYITELQEEFKEEVIELNAFKKRFGTYLRDTCDDNLQCYKKTINKLKSWDTVKQDKKLEYLIAKKSTLLEYDEKYWKNLVSKLNNKNIDLNESQFVSIIDLEKQLYIVALWNEDIKEFYYIGNDFISSGNIAREKEVKFGEDHYLKTPAGIFKSQYGWRSEGKTSDDNVTLGYGQKDRYIFYFGQHQSIRYNTFNEYNQKIYDENKWKLITDNLNLAVHSHKSTKPMGVPNSHGCIRMTDELNRFLDNNSILHKNILNRDKWIHKYSKEPNDSKYQNYAGEYLIVFDKI